MSVQDAVKRMIAASCIVFSCVVRRAFVEIKMIDYLQTLRLCVVFVGILKYCIR
jgi:hypothetical protein